MRSIVKVGALVALVLALNIVTVVVLMPRFPVTMAGPTDDECQPGDVNGDGLPNVADVVYLANWLFQDGPDPEACAQVVEVPVQVWPPRPENIVNLTGESVELESDVSLSIYTVPEGMALVVTNFVVGATLSDGTLNNEHARVKLLEEDDGVATIRRGKAFCGYRVVTDDHKGEPFSSLVGLTFASESEVSLLYDFGVAGVTSTVAYELVGYLVDEE